MPKTHPHAEATYRIISFDNGSFGVEVSIPQSHPTRVSTFSTQADAEARSPSIGGGCNPKHHPAAGFVELIAAAVSAPRLSHWTTFQIWIHAGTRP
jgi:hypothetical protein